MNISELKTKGDEEDETFFQEEDTGVSVRYGKFWYGWSYSVALRARVVLPYPVWQMQRRYIPHPAYRYISAN